MNDINFLDEIADFIFTSKYAQYNEEEKRRETWDECIDRVTAMHINKFRKKLSKEDLAEVKWAFEQVRNKTIVPSMRSMQFGGRAVLAHSARIYNCGKITTKFVTSAGVKSFADFTDGQMITVLTHTGSWRSAVVRNYGVQALNKITLQRCKKLFVEYFTPTHRWILRDGTVTTNLTVGDSLLSSQNIFGQFNYDTASPFEKLYWAYGYVFGDGTKVKDGQGEYRYSMVRLCGEDKARYLTRFEELGFSSSSPLSCQGDAMVYTGKYLKTPPNPEVDSPELIRAFVAGYLAADGSKSTGGGNNKYDGIQSSDPEHIEFIRACFPIAGVFIRSEKELTGQVTNYGTRPYTVRFSTYDSPNNQENSNSCFKVVSIEPDVEEAVWCLEVEEDASFVLPSGLVTGNCAVRHVDSPRAFAEVFYLLLCGCGVGLGLSKHFTGRLPDLVGASDKTGSVLPYTVEDSIEGWSDSIEALLNCYFRNTAYTGRKIVFDYSKIRPEGAPLKTSGGKAPGYKGLKNCHKKIKALLDHVIEDLGQTRMKPINAYDICMHVADAVLSGGIRRSATSVIFDLDDDEMMQAKTYFKATKYTKFSLDEDTKKYSGKVTVNKKVYEIEIDESKFEYQYKKLTDEGLVSWQHIEPQRGRSNNSVLLLRNQVTEEQFRAIVEKTQQFGEPGFVFADHPWQLFNPCFEIAFIPVTADGVCGVQFCNLSSINGAAIQSMEDYLRATKAATIIGTLQASYTENMRYLNAACRKLTEDEALLGVSITGVMDNPSVLLNEQNQSSAAKYAVQVNEEWAKKIGINPAARVTCIKPEGTSSLVLRSASGIHPHHAHRYFRRVQCNKLEGPYKLFKKNNPHMCEAGVWSANKTDDVITFPLTVSEKAMTKSDLTALKHLGIIRETQRNWVQAGASASANKHGLHHNVSCTVIVKDEEWKDVLSYLYDNRAYFGAVSLLPFCGDKLYQQAPLEAVTTPEDEEKWNTLVTKFTKVDYTKLHEAVDNTKIMESVACGGGKCELF